MRNLMLTLALLIPLTFGAAAQSTCGPTTVVNPTDTLEAIAARCNASVGELIRLNPGTESGLRAGDNLRLPNYAAAQAPPLISVNPLSGGPGTPLSVTLNGFPAYTEVTLRIGSVTSETADMQQVITTANGTSHLTMTIPTTASVGETYLILAEATDGRVNARSYGIDVAFARAGLFETSTLYLVALGDAGASGPGFGCRDSLVQHSIPIAPTIAPLRPALETLLASSSRTFPGTTYYNALNSSDLRVSRVAVLNRTAEIDLTGRLVIGGACDAPRIQRQLEQTALQFNTVDDVTITVNGDPLDLLLGLAPEPTPPPIPNTP